MFLLIFSLVPTVVAEVCIFANERLTVNKYLTFQIYKILALSYLVGYGLYIFGGFSRRDPWWMILGILLYW
jgi:hypothetical protein